MYKTLAQHDSIVLQFSGGKDSLACLHLCRQWWDKITVVWVNPGNPYPETVAQMARIRALVPRFVVVTGEQPQWIMEHGLPCDVVPILNTTLGQHIAGATGPRVQSTFDCCNHNLWKPMADTVKVLGATLIVRGQKQCDDLKGPLRDGDVVDGVTYRYPLANWTDADVLAYLERKGVAVPAQYKRGVNTSFDCWDCTGYAQHNELRWAQMKQTHPELWVRFEIKLNTVRSALRDAVAPYA